MKEVVIRQCPVWPGTRQHAARVAVELRNLPDVDVRLEDGAQGELTVLVDGRVIAQKKDSLPAPEEVVTAVRTAA